MKLKLAALAIVLAAALVYGAPSGLAERGQHPTWEANINGRWSEVGDWPFVAIHAALLPDGSVVTYGSDGDGGRGRTARFFYDVWDPSSGLADLSHRTLANTTSTDLFCSAQMLLPDSGDMLIAGGDTYTPTSATNPVDEDDNLATDATTILRRAPRRAANTPGLYEMSAGARMHRPRWYATLTMLPSGDIYIQGGRKGDDLPEIRTRDGRHILKPGIDTSSFDYWYPRNFVAPDGRIFGFGASDAEKSTDYKAGDMYNI